MNNAQSIIEQLTCLNLATGVGERVYDVRNGFSTVFTDLFKDITSVTDGNKQLKYTAKFWDNRNATVYNSIVIDDRHVKEVTITANWTLPADLQNVIDELTKLLDCNGGKTSRVKSKKIEDFSVVMSDNTEVEQFILDHKSIIDKYSICSISHVRNGKACL